MIEKSTKLTYGSYKNKYTVKAYCTAVVSKHINKHFTVGLWQFWDVIVGFEPLKVIICVNNYPYVDKIV